MSETISIEDFKAAMASFAAGVTVVTTLDPDGTPHALTATAFTSLSASPPMCLVCIDRRCRAHGPLMGHQRFAVNILSSAQRELSAQFASRAPDKFAGVEWHPGPRTGCPFIDGALARFECEVKDIFEGGDHDIFIGRLLTVQVHDGAPLVYWRGAYAELLHQA